MSDSYVAPSDWFVYNFSIKSDKILHLGPI